MKPNTTLVTIPALSDSSTLAKFQTTGDHVVILKMTGVGNNQPYDYRAGDKTFRFRWLSEQQGHILRVPLALWMQNKAKLAHELMDQRHLSHPIIAMIEMPAAVVLPDSSVDAQFALDCISATISSYNDRDSANTQESLRECLDRISNAINGTITETPFPSEMGAADTNPAQNVVGLSEEPTAAPAVGDNPLWNHDKQHVITASPAVDEFTSQGESDSSDPHKVDSAGSTPAPASISQADTAALSDLAYDSCDAPKRIKALAALLGVEESALREAIDLPASRVELAAAGWVRRKESQPA